MPPSAPPPAPSTHAAALRRGSVAAYAAAAVDTIFYLTAAIWLKNVTATPYGDVPTLCVWLTLYGSLNAHARNTFGVRAGLTILAKLGHAALPGFAGEPPNAEIKAVAAYVEALPWLVLKALIRRARIEWVMRYGVTRSALVGQQFPAKSALEHRRSGGRRIRCASCRLECPWIPATDAGAEGGYYAVCQSEDCADKHGLGPTGFAYERGLEEVECPYEGCDGCGSFYDLKGKPDRAFCYTCCHLVELRRDESPGAAPGATVVKALPYIWNRAFGRRMCFGIQPEVTMRKDQPHIPKP